MSDRMVRGILPEHGLRVTHVRVTENARMARMLHGLYPSSAHLFAESLTAGLLLASLEKDRSRVNLQLECDGPVRGLFVDADPHGQVRGYVKRPLVHFPGEAAAGARAALGGRGFLSVMHDQGGGNFYRGQVALKRFSIAGDLARYFEESEQVATALDMAIVPAEAEPLGDVAGLVVQKLPGGDDGALARARQALASGAYRQALRAAASPVAIIETVVGCPFELFADLEVAYRCRCSRTRARAAVSALGPDGLLDVLHHEREAVVTCEFCRARYVVSEEELREMEKQLRAEEGS
ncbi:MAG TPA: Hsp33 family molecular chaperone HslO [Anaeromyxobacteraceae bacterium]|nr:Hsp33 family molecular chaperone HslO [Anaeromyxobacteraceae bacterium]